MNSVSEFRLDEATRQFLKSKFDFFEGMEGNDDVIVPESARPERLAEIHNLIGQTLSSQDAHTGIELAMAVAASVNISKRSATPNPVWMLFVGGPSSAKTACVEGLEGASELVHFVSDQTENAFISMYRHEGLKMPDEKQLLARLDGKCYAIRDLTSFFSGKAERVHKWLGDMTSIFDGKFRKETGVGELELKSVFSTIACITPAALNTYQKYMASVGGRFLFFPFQPLTDDEQYAGYQLMNTSEKKKLRDERLVQLRLLMAEHMIELSSMTSHCTLESSHITERLWNYAQFIAAGRSVDITEPQATEFGKDRYVTVDQQEEGPFRVFQQLLTLAQCLALVHGRSVITLHETDVLLPIVWGSIRSNRSRFLQAFRQTPYQGVTKDCIGHGNTVSERQVSRLISDAMTCGLIEQREGRYWAATKFVKVFEPARTINHFQDLPPSAELSPRYTINNIGGSGGGFFRQNPPVILSYCLRVYRRVHFSP